MRCLTPQEISDWVRKVGQIEDPQHGESEPTFRIVFNAPKNYPACECFVRCFVEQVVAGGELLVVVFDSEPSQPCQEFVCQAMRLAVGETRLIREAPGFQTNFEEREKAVALFTLMSCFRWKCFLYGDHDQITLYNWEGEIFDVWTCSEAKQKQVFEIIQNFGLGEILDHES